MFIFLPNNIIERLKELAVLTNIQSLYYSVFPQCCTACGTLSMRLISFTCVFSVFNALKNHVKIILQFNILNEFYSYSFAIQL